jgi:hypothetical protein
MLTVIAAGMVACAGENAPEPAAGSQDSPSRVARPGAVMELGNESYTFESATCDLDDRIDDDVLLQARGTAPDGRRMTLEVERREVGDILHDRVTLYFGSIVDGDHWNATASGRPGGGWATEVGEPLDGPLVMIRGGELSAAGTFVHETRDATQALALRVRCEG